MGAPTKYDPKYCKEIVAFARNAEGNFRAFAISIGVHSDTLNEWAKVHPNFSAAKKRAKEINEAAMLKIGMAGMKGHNGSGSWQAAWIFAMKARYGWREEAPPDEEENELEFDFS